MVITSDVSLGLPYGIVLAFVGEKSIENFIAGVYMKLSKPFNLNDTIKVGSEIEGRVLEIGLCSTKLLDKDMFISKISSSTLLSKGISNRLCQTVKMTFSVKCTADALLHISDDIESSLLLKDFVVRDYREPTCVLVRVLEEKAVVSVVFDTNLGKPAELKKWKREVIVSVCNIVNVHGGCVIEFVA